MYRARDLQGHARGGSFRITRSCPGFLLGVVRGKVVEEAFKWVQSTADSVLGCFLVHLTTPVRSKKESEYFCPGLLKSSLAWARSLFFFDRSACEPGLDRKEKVGDF